MTTNGSMIDLSYIQKHHPHL